MLLECRNHLRALQQQNIRGTEQLNGHVNGAEAHRDTPIVTGHADIRQLLPFQLLKELEDIAFWLVLIS